ncbi:MAG: energy-coupling factor transporter transmembrane protein EcfT [Eubacterium sp.]|nr:energy-coupling factor transporter transmembrane protein EcfT [Eubacterium sp.]
MIRDITIGQYYPADSLLHRLDPRVKFTGTIVYIVSLFLCRSWGYVFAALFLMCMILLSKVPFKYMIRGLRAILFILLFTMVLNIFLTPGTILWQWKIFKITEEGLRTAIVMAVRLILLILGASVMTLTTTPNKLTGAMESLFRPLSKIGVPVHEIAMMMSIALRFIPILLEETDKIMKAQMARGADFESGGLIKRVKAMVPLLVPLFISAFRRANDLALAMEARCYHGGEGRTQMKPLVYTKKDILAYLVLAAYLAVIIVLRVVWKA